MNLMFLHKTSVIFALLILNISTFQPLTKELAGKFEFPEQSYHGYVPITRETANDNNTTADDGKDPNQMFYWWFPSRSSRENDPLVQWLTGGPGCSSELALFVENGPFKINPNTLELETNKFSWNNEANLQYVDQPLGTGFSSVDTKNYVEDEETVAKDMFEFLTKFIEQFPEFKGRDFYIAGESYAGHYVPHISDYLNQQLFSSNSDKNVFGINFRGLSIGNGMINPWVQYEGYATYAYENKLINYQKYMDLLLGFRECETMMKFNVAGGLQKCQNLYGEIVTWKAGNFDQVGSNDYASMKFNNYDITKPCQGPLCYNFGFVDTFMNLHKVKNALGVPQDKLWQDCNAPVGQYMAKYDWIKNSASKFKNLLENGLKVLLYHGELDMICNWVGGELAANSIEWFGEVQWQSATWHNVGYGLKREYMNFAFIKFSDSGHMVPMDQPENAYKMIKWFIDKDSSNLEEI